MFRVQSIFLGAIVVLGITITDVKGQDEDGAFYLQRCGFAIKVYDGDETSPEQSLEALKCTSYIKGFLDGHSVTNLQVNKKQVCIEDGVTVSQVVRIFVNFLKENPKTLNKSGRAVLFVSLKTAYPCAN